MLIIVDLYIRGMLTSLFAHLWTLCLQLTHLEWLYILKHVYSCTLYACGAIPRPFRITSFTKIGNSFHRSKSELMHRCLEFFSSSSVLDYCSYVIGQSFNAKWWYWAAISFRGFNLDEFLDREMETVFTRGHKFFRLVVLLVSSLSAALIWRVCERDGGSCICSCCRRPHSSGLMTSALTRWSILFLFVIFFFILLSIFTMANVLAGGWWLSYESIELPIFCSGTSTIMGRYEAEKWRRNRGPRRIRTKKPQIVRLWLSMCRTVHLCAHFDGGCCLLCDDLRSPRLRNECLGAAKTLRWFHRGQRKKSDLSLSFSV